ncbi:hypothetical protein RLOC_00006289 [Lonchura striata]|uniref:Uncharacterized protein n=1 Tax=Lonchura striata TaxID=40157 RepID=A0A218UC05_9PASE|nr:hypothetical protein RLOC_00006289 [Lonchura striata domestica]
MLRAMPGSELRTRS